MALHEPPGLPAFAESLSQLEARIAVADAGGDAVPPEALQMVVKLRELVAALGDLTSSLDTAPTAEAARSSSIRTPDPASLD